MKTIVTGAKGFIGTALVRALVSNSHTVAEINRVNSSGLFSGLSLISKLDIQEIANGIGKIEQSFKNTMPLWIR